MERTTVGVVGRGLPLMTGVASCDAILQRIGFLAVGESTARAEMVDVLGRVSALFGMLDATDEVVPFQHNGADSPPFTASRLDTANTALEGRMTGGTSAPDEALGTTVTPLRGTTGHDAPIVSRRR